MKMRLKIVDLLAKNAGEKFTINKIAESLNEYYSFVYRTVNELIKEGVIIKNEIGRAHLCSLNLENEKTLALIQLSEIEKRDEFYSANKELKLILEDFVKSLEPQSSILSVVLFGSYAKGNATRESDIDILLISKRKAKTSRIIKEIYAKYGKEIMPILMTPSDFKKQKDKAIIREVVNNHYVLHGVENFVNLVFKNKAGGK